LDNKFTVMKQQR